ncbi:DJ-1 [Zopfia rhizophila CBS 207.26]|uniref:D-lactate dehydratase n=1 Tax=Zopfia rhizophila CBS 207.26 TaxID=1314779 RepID=A0A6A6EEJ3_9PEZI|nr:DJ-1 [Zopfia rhizophila CBS 207.26]
MPKALILIADGSEEIEFVTPYDVLTRAGFEVKSAGVKLENENWATCTRNVRIVPDHPTLISVPSQSAHEVFDVLVIPGGGPGAKTFSTYDPVLELIHEFRKAGKYVAAICAGTTALVAAEEKFHGAGHGKKATVTSHPSVESQIKEKGWGYSNDRVVVDGKVITSRGPGTALLFALTIVGLISGNEKRDEVARPMIVAETL